MRPLRTHILLSAMLCCALPAVAQSTPGGTPQVVWPSADPMVGQPVPAFTATLMDIAKTPPTTSEYDSKKANKVTSYIFLGSHCPATASYLDRFKAIERDYAAKGLQTVYLYPNHEDTGEVAIGFHRQRQLVAPFIDDKGGAIAKLFKAVRTSEVFLVDSKGTIVYHGALDDNRDYQKVQKHYLADALNEVFAGKSVSVNFSQVFA